MSELSGQKINQSNVDSVLSEISLKDRLQLEVFFEILVKNYPFAYTFFGDKPCSIACYHYVYQDLVRNPYFLTNSALKHGWEVWSKFGHLFPSDKFIIREIKEEDKEKYTYGASTIILINKNATRKMLRENLLFFQKKLNNNLDEDEIVRKLSEDVEFLNKCIGDYESLGMFLGFGKKNAIGFEREVNLCININLQSIPPLQSKLEQLNSSGKFFVDACSRLTQKPKLGSETPSLGFSSLIEELNSLRDNNKGFELLGSEYILEEVQSPAFVVFNKEETKNLCEKYSKTRELVIDAYDGKSILEVSLNQF